MNEQSKAMAAPRRTIRDLLNSEASKAEIAKVLPKHLTPDRITRVALTAITRTPKLLECSPESLMQAVMVCSQAGLEPDGRLAHLIPYGNVCQVIFDWKGLVTLGLRNGFESIYADVVCEKDDFDAWVEDGAKRLRHRVNWKQERGDAYLFYCVTKKAGVLDYEIMTLAETESIHQRSKAKNAGPWLTDPLEMRKKCAIRRMSKRWDLLPEIRDIIYAEDDLPADIQKPVMSRPIFELPKAGEAPPVEVQPESESSEPAGLKSNGHKPVDAVRKLAKMGNVQEGEILTFLSEQGATDGSPLTLDEVPGAVLETLVDKWFETSKEIKAARKEGLL